MKTVEHTAPLPNRYKPHYGIRQVNNYRMIYGFDVFHMVASHGLDLEIFLEFCKENSIDVDWFNFIRSAIKSDWSLKTTLGKIIYPAEYVFGKEYSEELRKRCLIEWLEYNR